MLLHFTTVERKNLRGYEGIGGRGLVIGEAYCFSYRGMIKEIQSIKEVLDEISAIICYDSSNKNGLEKRWHEWLLWHTMIS